MAENKQFTLQFNADVSQAKRALSELQKSLNKMSTVDVEVEISDSALKKASKAAQDLKKYLEEATNVNTGELNLNTFINSLNRAGTSVTQLGNALLDAGQTGQAAFSQLASVVASAEIPIKRMNNTLAAWGQTLKNTVQWELSSTMIHGLESALSEAVSYVKDLNSSLIDIRIVTGQSAEDMAQFAIQANRAARELSTTTKAYADASLIYYQQGDSVEQAAKKAAITIKAANASFDSSAEEMSEYLTAVWNSYSAGADELEKYVDIMSSLGAETATSLEEIATAMQKVAATANTVGVSMEQMSSIIATVSSVTREAPESIGTSFKTILARMGDLKLGETLDDGVSLGTVSSTLDDIGVKLLDTNGEMRDMGDIIEDLGNKWQTMGQAQKAAIAQVVAGKRQYTQLMALFEHWDMYQSNLTISENSDGSLQKMADIYAESWEAASKRVQAAWEKIFTSLINDRALIEMTKGIETAVTALGGLIDGMGGVAGIAGSLGGILTSAFSEQIANNITKIGHNIKNAFLGIDEKSQFLQYSAKLRSELSSLSKDSSVLDPARQNEINASLLISEKKDYLVKNQKNLSQEQIAQAQSVLTVYQSQIAALNQLISLESKRSKQMEVDQKDLITGVNNQEAKVRAKKDGREYAFLNAKERQKYQKEAEKQFMVDAVDVKVKVKFNKQDMEAEVDKVAQELHETFSGLEGFDEIANLSFSEVITQASKLVTAFGDVKNGYAQLSDTFGTVEEPKIFASGKDNQQILQDLLKYTQQLQELSGKTGSVVGADLIADLTGNGKKTLEEVFSGDQTEQQITELFNKISTAYSKFEGQLETGVPNLKALILSIVPEELAGKFEALFAEWEKGSSKIDKFEQKAQEAAAAMEKAFSAAAEKVSSKLNSMLDIAGALESIYGLINAFQGLVDTFKDPEVSGWEKFGAALGFVITAITTLISISQGVTAVLSLFSVAAGAAGAGAAGATPGFAAFGAAVNTAIWPLTLIIGVLALAVAAFMAFRSEVQKPITIEEEVTALNKQLDLLTQKLESTKAYISSLEDSFDSYTSVREALDNCTEGTSAWYSALANVQSKTLELLSQYPLLAKILDNPTKYFGEDFDLSSLYDEHGLVNMDLLMTKALEVERQEYGMQKAFAAIAQTELSRRETAMSLSSDNDRAVNMPDRETIKHDATLFDWNGWTEEVLPEVVLEYFPHWEDISLRAPVVDLLYNTAYLTNGKYRSISSIGDISGTINEIMPEAVSLVRDADNVPTTQRTFSEEYQEVLDYFTNLGYDPETMDFDKILDVVLAEAFAYGQENGITNMDNAIVKYIRVLPTGLQKILNYSIGAGTTLMTDEQVARTFVSALHDVDILTDTSEAAYGVNYNTYQQSTVSIPQEYRVLAADMLAEQSEQGVWSQEQMDFFEAALPHWIEDELIDTKGLDLIAKPSAAELADYQDYLSYYSPEEAADYDWSTEPTFDPTSGIVTFKSKADSEKTYEVPISTIRTLDKVQEMMSNPIPMLSNLANVYEQVGNLGDSYQEGAIFQKLLTAQGDLSVLTSAELKDLQDNDALAEFVKSITGLYGEAAATGLTSENIGNILSLSWSDALTIAQQNAVDNLGPYVSNQVKKWLASEEGKGREQELFVDGRLVPDLSIISPELASFMDNYNSDSGINALLNFQSQIPALGATIQELQDGSLIDQEELELLTKYTNVAPELFKLMSNGYKYVGEQTASLMGQMIKDSNTLYTNLTRFEAEPILDFSNLSDMDRELLRMLLGLDNDQLTEWLATAGSEEKEAVNKNLAVLWRGREALRTDVEQLGAWYATVTKFSDITDAGLTWDAIPSWAQNMIVENIATQAGHDLEELQLYDADGKISSETEYNAAVKSSNRSTGLRSLLGMESTIMALNEFMEEGGTLTENTEGVAELLKALSQLFDIDITIDQLKNNWSAIAGLYSSTGTVTDLAKNFGIDGTWTDEDAWFNATFAEDAVISPEQYDAAIKYAMSKANLQEGYFDIGRTAFETLKPQIRTAVGIDEKTGKIINTDAANAWLVEMGYLQTDKEGNIVFKDGKAQLTETGLAIASDIDGLYTAIETAYINGAKAFNIANGKFSQRVKSAYEEIINTKNGGSYVFDTAEDQETMANILANAETSAGQIGIDRMKEMLEAVPAEELDKFSNALSGVDWGDPASVQAFKDRLEAAGFALEEPLQTAINAVATAAQAAAEALMSLVDAANIYKTRTDIADKIREGEALTAEEYAEVIAAYAEQEKTEAKANGEEISDTEAYKRAELRARGEFEANRWGEYELSNSVNLEDWAANLESVAMAGFDTILESIETATTTQKDEERNFSDEKYTNQESAIAGLIAGNSEKFTPYGIKISDEEQTALQALSSATTADDRASAMKDLIALGWDSEKWSNVLIAFDQIIDGIKEETAEAKADATTGTGKDNFEAGLSDLATRAGFGSAEELKEYTEYLKKLGEINGETEEDNIKLAASYARIQKGLKSVQSNLKTYTKALKEAQKGTTEHKKALDDMRDTYADVLDLDDKGAKALTEDFMTQEDVLKDLQNAADGVDGAYDQLQQKATQHILDQLTGDVDISSMTDEIAALSTAVNTLPEGKALNWSELLGEGEMGQVVANNLASLTGFVSGLASNANEAAGIMQALAAALGMDMQVETREFPVEQTEWSASTGSYIAHGENGQDFYIPLSVHANPVDGMVKGFAIKTITNKGTYGGGIKSGSSSGGGGGGGKAKKLDKKQGKDEKKRYFQVDNALDTLTDALTKVDKLKERAFGEGHLKNLESEISLLQQEVEIQEDYIEQAKSWLAVDRNAVLELGATFDGEGNISNYDEMMNSIIAKYNAFIDKYNAASASKQEDMADEKEEMDEWYEDAIDAIDQYQETLALIREKENDILETQNKISERALEAIQYKVEYKVEINEAENDYLEYLNDKYEDVLDSQDLLMDNYIRQGELAQDNLNNLGVAYKELEAAYAAGTLTQADYVEGLQDIQDQTLENLKTIQDVKEELGELYEDTLDLADEQITKHTDKIDNAAEAMESYISIMGLLGKKTNYDQILTFYQKQYEYNLASLESQVSYLNVLKEEEQYYLDRMNSAEGLTETERVQYEALEETLMEVNNNVLSKTQETLEALQTMYNTTIEGIMKKLEESIVGVDNDIAWVMEQYGYYTEEVEQYVSASRELYEISKLNRNINQSINDTTSSVHKKRLKELQDEISAKSEANQLSEYDLNMMDLKYQLLLKQIALEEAQNAKSTVRLTRDSEGNMIYAYTADQNAVNQAQQEYEDVLQQMSDANYSALTDIQQTTLQLQQETLQSIQEIAEDETLTQEQKNQRIGEIIEHYYTRLEQLSQQYSNVSQNTMETDLLIAEHYNTSVSSLASATQNEVTSLVKDMLTNTQGQKEAMNQTYADIIEAMGQYEEQVDQVTNTTDLSFDTMTDSISSYNSVVQDAQTETNKLTQELQTELTQINKTTDAWDNYYDTLGDVIKQYENLYESIQKTIKAQSSVVTQVASSSVNVSTGATTASSNSNSSSSSSSSSSSGSGNSGSSSNSSTSGSTYTPYKTWQVALSTDGGKTWGSFKTKYSDADNVSGPATALYGAWQSGWAIKYRRYFETGWSNYFTHYKYANGGLADYTGPAWLDGTKNSPELVLNADDTQNMLQIVSEVRQLDKSTLSMVDDLINLATISMYSNLASVHAGSIANTSNTSEIEQNVHITAEFPNVQNSNEIQDAFDNLVNRAAQYVGSLKR